MTAARSPSLEDKEGSEREALFKGVKLDWGKKECHAWQNLKKPRQLPVNKYYKCELVRRANANAFHHAEVKSARDSPDCERPSSFPLASSFPVVFFSLELVVGGISEWSLRSYVRVAGSYVHRAGLKVSETEEQGPPSSGTVIDVNAEAHIKQAFKSETLSGRKCNFLFLVFTICFSGK